MTRKSWTSHTEESRSPEEVLAILKENLQGSLEAFELRPKKETGREGQPLIHDIWLTVRKDAFLSLVDELFLFDFPHFHVLSTDDSGDHILFVYHFSLFRSAGRGKHLGVNVRVRIPKEDLIMPSLWERIPGVEYSEREAKEALGVVFQGLPNQSLLLLPENWDTSIKPMRRDETGPREEHIRHLS